MIIILKGADFSESKIGTLDTWMITRLIGAGATYEGATSVDKDAPFSATITIAEGYELGTAGVTVTMGGTEISAATVSGNTITISIASVTGNVVIKVPTVNVSGGEEEPEVLTVYMTDPSKDGMFIMDYQNVFAIQANDSAKTKSMQFLAADVSKYVGRNISITATQAVIEGAYYSIFTNALAGDYSLESLPSLSRASLPETISSGKKHTLNRDIIVDKFVVSTESLKTNTIQKTIPANAKYLYVTNVRADANTPQTSEPSITLI